MENTKVESENKKQKNAILVSNLGLFTEHGDVLEYFGQFGPVKEAAFIHADDLTYTRACKVKMDSADSLANILGIPHHFINGREVTVEAYVGKSEHQWLFLKGKYKLVLEGLPVDLSEYSLYMKLENAFAKCGRYSEIELMKKPNHTLSGVAEIDFIKEGDIAKAMKVAREELKCKAFSKKRMMI